jgi:membrane peptidoglycan carboxypeptidase
MTFSGTLGAHGHVSLDTRWLDDLQLDYEVADGCRAVRVPAVLDRAAFGRPFGHRIYLPDGSVRDEETGPGTPDWTPLERTSPFLEVAVTTTEDGAFRRHHGFNKAALRAALIADLKAHRFLRGASTITMQLAKNLFLSREKTLSRKLEEAIVADYIEQAFSKDEILELYFNVVEFGPAVYGVGPAAEYYFGRSPAELNLSESFFLASILPAPLRYSSMRDAGEVSDAWLRNLRVLMRVAHQRGLLTEDELNEGLQEPVQFWRSQDRPPPRAPISARRRRDVSRVDIEPESDPPTELDP